MTDDATYRRAVDRCDELERERDAALAECERLMAALKEFISIVSESAEFEAAMLEPDGNFAEFLNKQQARVDSAVANASALLDAARKVEP